MPGLSERRINRRSALFASSSGLVPVSRHSKSVAFWAYYWAGASYVRSAQRAEPFFPSWLDCAGPRAKPPKAFSIQAKCINGCSMLAQPPSKPPQDIETPRPRHVSNQPRPSELTTFSVTALVGRDILVLIFPLDLPAMELASSYRRGTWQKWRTTTFATVSCENTPLKCTLSLQLVIHGTATCSFAKQRAKSQSRKCDIVVCWQAPPPSIHPSQARRE